MGKKRGPINPPNIANSKRMKESEVEESSHDAGLAQQRHTQGVEENINVKTQHRTEALPVPGKAAGCIEINCPASVTIDTPIFLDLPQVTKQVLLRPHRSRLLVTPKSAAKEGPSYQKNDPPAKPSLNADAMMEKAFKFFSHIGGTLKKAHVASFDKITANWREDLMKKTGARLKDNLLTATPSQFVQMHKILEKMVEEERESVSQDTLAASVKVEPQPEQDSEPEAESDPLPVIKPDIGEEVDPREESASAVEGDSDSIWETATCQLCQEHLPSITAKRTHILQNHYPEIESVVSPDRATIDWDKYLTIDNEESSQTGSTGVTRAEDDTITTTYEENGTLPSSTEADIIDPARCEKCGLKAAKPALLQRHRRLCKRRLGNLQCQQCKRVFRLPGELKNHLSRQDHLSCKPVVVYRCLHCPRRATLSGIKRHVIRVHFEDPALRPNHCLKDMYKCPLCKQLFNMAMNCHQHMSICTKPHTSSETSDLTEDIFMKYIEDVDPPAAVPLRDHDYEKPLAAESKLDSSETLQEFQDREANNKKHNNNDITQKADMNYDEISDETKRSTSVSDTSKQPTTHIKEPQRTQHFFRQKTESKRATCTQCSYTGTYMAVRSHMRRNHASMSLKCSHCEMKFSCGWLHRRHMISHFDDAGKLKSVRTGKGRMVKCKLCNFMSTNHGLRVHLSTSHEEEIKGPSGSRDKFICSTCGKAYTRKTRFLHHESTCNGKTSDDTSVGQEEDEISSYILQITPESEPDASDGESQGTADGKLYAEGDIQDLHTDAENPEPKAPWGSLKSRIKQLTETFPDNGYPLKLKYIFSCVDCGYISTYDGVKAHQKRFHRQAKYQCKHCQRKFSLPSEHRRHEKSHYKQDGSLKQSIIGASKYNLPCSNRNKMKVGGSVYDTQFRFECKICSYRNRYELLYQHVKKYHIGESHKCPHCEKDFAEKNGLKGHIQLHMKDNQVVPIGIKPQKVTSWKCKHCDEVFGAKGRLTRHIIRKHKNKTLQCPHCDKAYAAGYDLKAHLKKAHTESNHCLCEDCGSVFTCQAYLKSHIRRMHNPDSPFLCQECGREFKDKVGLNKHMKSHKKLSERPRFPCTECGKFFLSKKYLSEHMNQHTGANPYTCKECGQAFRYQAGYSKHMKVHRSKSLECPVEGCNYRCSTLMDQGKHLMRRHKGLQTYPCTNCGRKFGLVTLLQRHICRGRNSSSEINQLAGEMNIKLEAPEEVPTAETPGEVFMCAVCNKVMVTFEEAQQHALEEHGAEETAMEDAGLGVMPETVVGGLDTQLYTIPQPEAAAIDLAVFTSP